MWSTRGTLMAVCLVAAVPGGTAVGQQPGARAAAARGRSVPVTSLLERADVRQSRYSQESALEDSIATVVRDSAGWARLWRRIDGEAEAASSSPAPRVDFGHEMVLVYGLGRQLTMGMTQLMVESATLRGDTLVALVRRTRKAGTRCAFPNDGTDSPLAVAITARHAGPVRFVAHDVKAACPALNAPSGGKARPRR